MPPAKPIDLQKTDAALSSQFLSQTVPHTPLCFTSTRPDVAPSPGSIELPLPRDPAASRTPQSYFFPVSRKQTHASFSHHSVDTHLTLTRTDNRAVMPPAMLCCKLKLTVGIEHRTA